MKYQGIRKMHEGKFITRYDVDYVTEEGHPKTYEIISRNKNIQTLEQLQNKQADSVVMILTDESGDRILVSREYRMAMAQWIYNFPAGLIDPGETPEESAKRELWEETGLELSALTTCWTTATALWALPTSGTCACSARHKGNSAKAPPTRRKSFPAGTRRKKSKSC